MDERLNGRIVADVLLRADVHLQRRATIEGDDRVDGERNPAVYLNVGAKNEGTKAIADKTVHGRD